MRYFRFFLSAAATFALIFLLNTKLGQAPPFGKFLNPATGFWQNAESERDFRSEDLALEGLRGKVQVHFDQRLVPHIFAQNEEDLYFMQGYITARYRLWQMEVQTHNAAGRVSEIVGEKALENDRLQRRIGLGFGAERAADYIHKDEESSRLIEAYCEGVNAFISSLSPKDYPLEYKLLDYEPEEWKPEKVALLLKNMANMLSIFEYDIENHNFIARYGMEAFRQLYPDFNDKEDPIIPVGTPWGSDIGGKGATAKARTAALHVESKAMFANALNKPDEITGSNNWAVGGNKTASGKPILCNDPHLKLSLPSIWYEMHLVAPGVNVYGATLPGAPAVIIGFNDSISWGVTNAGRDVRDWYQIRFKDDSRDEYQVNGKWLKSVKRVERYAVRGRGEVIDTVIYTRYGPVVFDRNFGEAKSKHDLAMSWVAHLPSNEFKTFYLLNKGKNYDDYIEALNNYACPAQNFVFASRSGDIAIKQQGKFPVRNRETEQGKYLSDGTKSTDDWGLFIPNEANPVIKNPDRGFVSSANQHPTEQTYPYYYPGLGVYENYRNRRINQLLTENNGIDGAFMRKMQNDNFNLHAKEALPVLLSLLPPGEVSADEKEITEALSAWNYFNEENLIAPVYFEIWWNELRQLLWDEMADKKYPMKQPNFETTVRFLMQDSVSAFYDNLATAGRETRKDIISRAFHRIKDTMLSGKFTEVSEPYGTDATGIKDDLNTTDWGKFKDTKVAHLGGLDAFSALHVYNGGNLGVINATNSTHGPSWRMVVDLSDMTADVIYPGGQSGNPGSRFFSNMVGAWSKGEYYKADFSANSLQIKSKQLFELRFVPHP